MSAGHTAGEWQTKHDYSLEGLATIIANVDGEIIEGGNHYTYDTVAICADEFGEYLPNAASNARLIVAACNSYDRHYGPRAIEAAEADLLGKALEALRISIDSNKAELASLLNSVCLHDSNGPVRGTAELGSLPDVERLENAIYEGEAILSQAREVK